MPPTTVLPDPIQVDGELRLVMFLVDQAFAANGGVVNSTGPIESPGREDRAIACLFEGEAPHVDGSQASEQLPGCLGYGTRWCVAAVPLERLRYGRSNGRWELTRGEISHIGDRSSATQLMYASIPGSRVFALVLVAGDDASVKAGASAHITAGKNSTVSALHGSTVVAGADSHIDVGHYSSVTAGLGCTIRAGHGTVIYIDSIQEDGVTIQVAGEVGRDGIETNVPLHAVNGRIQTCGAG